MPTAERYLKTVRFASGNPRVSLRGAILLPRASLPLNVFEPRYLAMVDWALRHDRIIGIIQPNGGAEEEESPLGKHFDLRSVGCAGRLVFLPGVGRWPPRHHADRHRAFPHHVRGFVRHAVPRHAGVVRSIHRRF